jgi:hypothetical protein
LNNPAASCGNLSKNTVTANIFLILPVDLLPLTAIRENQRVKLYWGTESESNSRNFEIERSGDGRNFIVLKPMPASGNSVSRINYTTYDDTPLPDKNFYRVKAISLDGTFTYTNIALVKNLIAGFEVNTYPNPVRDKFILEIIAAAKGIGNIEIISANGSTVGKQKINWQKGINVETIDMRNLSSGVYYIKIISGTGTITTKAIKM